MSRIFVCVLVPTGIYKASQSYPLYFLCTQCFYIYLYCKCISYGVLPPLHHYILFFTFFSILLCKVNHLKVSLCQQYFYLAFYCTNSIIILSNIFLTEKISHKHLAKKLGHLSIVKKTTNGNSEFSISWYLQMKTRCLSKQHALAKCKLNTRIPERNPRAYNIRKARFVSPLEASSPSYTFGLKAQKSKKIHNRASYNLIFLKYLKCIKQGI